MVGVRVFCESYETVSETITALFKLYNHTFYLARNQITVELNYLQMITVHITGLVIPSANNVFKYVFFPGADYSKAYIFFSKILPLINLMRVYIVGIIF